jgi:hypothetical protein
MGVKKSLGYAVGIVSVIDVLVVIAVFAGPNKHGAFEGRGAKDQS